MKIKLNTVTEVNDFCRIASGYESDVIVSHGKYAVDGKSLMGLYSLNLSEVLNVEFVSKDEDENDFWDKISKMNIIVGGNC